MGRLFIFFLLMVSMIYFSACKSNSDKKETAKKYISEQLKGKNAEKEIGTIMDFDKKVKVIIAIDIGELVARNINSSAKRAV